MTLAPVWTPDPDEWEADLLSVVAERVRDEDCAVARFDDDAWPLGALGKAGNGRTWTLQFETVPDPFRLTLKRVMWLIINTPTPDVIVKDASKNARKWVSASTINVTFGVLRELVIWLSAAHQVSTLAQVTPSMLEHWEISLEGRVARKGRRIGQPVRTTTINAWLHRAHLLHELRDDLPPDDRLVRPPWLDERRVRRHNERAQGNSTEELSPLVYGPLVVWATRLVLDFADDIQAAHARRQELDRLVLTSGPQTDHAKRIVESWLTAHEGLPRGRQEVGHGEERRPSVGLTYLSRMSGEAVKTSAIKHYISRFHPDLRATEPALLDTPITGLLEGRPWIDGIDYYETDAWMALLRDACMIVVGLGTALRPHEFLSLQVDVEKGDGSAHPAIETVTWPNGQTRWLVHGRLYKGQRTLDGKQLLEGIPTTWDTTRLGARAIEVAAATNDGSPWLFHGRSGGRGSLDAAMTTPVAQDHIALFVKRLNAFVVERGLPGAYFMPVDDDAPIQPSQFRRTAIAMIEDQDQGLLAAAHQAKHLLGSVLDTRTTQGYGDISQAGSLVHERRAALAAEAATDLAVAIAVDHDGISGPALARAMKVVGEVGGALMRLSDRREVERIARSSGQKIYRSPKAIGWCVHQRLTAACGNGEDPDLGQCQLGCANLVRTDHDIAGVLRKIEALEAEAEVLPKPAADRKRRLASRYRDIADKHAVTAVHLSIDVLTDGSDPSVPAAVVDQVAGGEGAGHEPTLRTEPLS